MFSIAVNDLTWACVGVTQGSGRAEMLSGERSAHSLPQEV